MQDKQVSITGDKRVGVTADRQFEEFIILRVTAHLERCLHFDQCRFAHVGREKLLPLLFGYVFGKSMSAENVG